MGGTPVFAGTRVPVQTLLDYLEGGESIDDFLDGFPSVSREQAVFTSRRYLYLVKRHGLGKRPRELGAVLTWLDPPSTCMISSLLISGARFGVFHTN